MLNDTQMRRTKRVLYSRVAVTFTAIALLISVVTVPATATTKKKVLAPINVMTISTESGTAVALQPAIGATALVYEKWVNANGGIAGHKLHVTNCNDQGEEAQAVICAQDAVSSKDVAVVGSFSGDGDQEIIPILQQANVAYFGDPAGAFPEDLTSPISFPALGSGPQNAGEVAVAYQNGCKEVSVVVGAGAGAELYDPIFEAAAKAYGETLNQIVQVPATAADYTPYVTQALGGGTDCVVTALGTEAFTSFLPPWAASGTKAVIYEGGALLSATDCSPYCSSVNGSYNISEIPNFGSPVLKVFRQALTKYKAPTGSAYNYGSITGVGVWAGYVLFTNVAKTIKGKINHSSFLAAARDATHVSSDGILPIIDYAKPWTSGPAGLLRYFDCGITVQQLENGDFISLSPDFQNADNLLAGTGKLGPKLPPTSSKLACQQ